MHQNCPHAGAAAGVPSMAGQRHSCAALLKKYRSCNHSLAVYLVCRLIVTAEQLSGFRRACRFTLDSPEHGK